MKPATSALVSYLLSTDATIVADLYTFALKNGETYRFAEYNLPISAPESSFPGSPLNSSGGTLTFAQGPRFGRSKTTQKVGVEPDTLQIEVYPNPSSDFLGNAYTWQETAQSGGFDGAVVELDRFYFPIGGDGITGAMNTTLGAIVWFYGAVSEPVEISRSLIKFTVKDPRNLLSQQQMPRRLFQTGCTHIFGDAMCGFNRTTGQNALGTDTGYQALTVTAIAYANQAVVYTGGISPAPPGGEYTHYVQGTLIGTSGANDGFTSGIYAISPIGGYVYIYLTKPLPNIVVTDDTFTMLPGCDHSSGTCNGIFQNLLRYGGFDYIPPPEIAL